MKNKLKYLICILAFLLLTACGGVVKTDMNFDDSFAGSRVMTYTISNSDYTCSKRFCNRSGNIEGALS